MTVAVAAAAESRLWRGDGRRDAGGGGRSIIRLEGGRVRGREMEGGATRWKGGLLLDQGGKIEGLGDVERVAEVNFGGRMRVGSSLRTEILAEEREFWRRSVL